MNLLPTLVELPNGARYFSGIVNRIPPGAARQPQSGISDGTSNTFLFGEAAANQSFGLLLPASARSNFFNGRLLTSVDLTTEQQSTRPRYFDGRFLSARDLTRDQDYLNFKPGRKIRLTSVQLESIETASTGQIVVWIRPAGRMEIR